MTRTAVTLLGLALLAASGCLPRVGPEVDAGAGGGGGAGSGGGGGGGGLPASCSDSAKDGDETDVDCGGSCASCAFGLGCGGPLDCDTGVCAAGHCAMPAAACGAWAGCTVFTDLTDPAANRTINFGSTHVYDPKCIRVRLGQQVTFSGSFANHPLRQGCGPVLQELQGATGNAATFTLDRALGVYGYYCDQHGSPTGSGMAGAIEVVR